MSCSIQQTSKFKKEVIVHITNYACPIVRLIHFANLLMHLIFITVFWNFSKEMLAHFINLKMSDQLIFLKIKSSPFSSNLTLLANETSMTNQRLPIWRNFFSINSPSESVVMISLVRMWFRNLRMRHWLMMMLRSWMNMMLGGKVTKTMTLLTTANGKQLTLKNHSLWCDDKRNFHTTAWKSYNFSAIHIFFVK